MRTFGNASLIDRSGASSLPSVDSGLMSPLACDLLLGFETQDQLSFETEKAMCTRMRLGVTLVAPCQQRYRDVQGATHEVDRLRRDDFSEICSTEVIEQAASLVIEEAMAVPGRAVTLLVPATCCPWTRGCGCSWTWATTRALPAWRGYSARCAAGSRGRAAAI